MSTIASDYIKNLSVGQFLVQNSLTLDDLLVWAQRGLAGEGSFPAFHDQGGQLPLAVPGTAPATDPQEVQLRTPEQREAYDDKIRRALFGVEGGWIRGAKLRELTGGKSGQLRSRLDALIEAGDVECQGQAAGMQYKLTRKCRDRLRREETSGAEEEATE